MADEIASKDEHRRLSSLDGGEVEQLIDSLAKITAQLDGVQIELGDLRDRVEVVEAKTEVTDEQIMLAAIDARLEEIREAAALLRRTVR